MARNNKKGQIAIYITAVIFSLILIAIAAVLAPMGVRFNAEAYRAGEMILNQSLPVVNNITNADVRNELNGTLTSAMLATEDTITVNANIFQYGWIAVVGLTCLVLFLYTRRLVEYGGGGIV